jgi:hypothetical protein
MDQFGGITIAMKHRNDEKFIAANPVDHGEREPAEQDPAATAGYEGEHFRIAYCRSYCGVQGPCELEAKTGCTGLIPSLSLQDLRPGLRPKKHAH